MANMASMAVLAYLSRVLRLILKDPFVRTTVEFTIKRSGPLTSHILCTERLASFLSCMTETKSYMNSGTIGNVRVFIKDSGLK